MNPSAPNNSDLPGYHKTAVIKVPVPFRMPGNVIEQLFIDFEVLVNGSFYRAIPLCNKQDKIKTMLPDHIDFERRGGRIIAVKNQYKLIADDIISGLIKKML